MPDIEVMELPGVQINEDEIRKLVDMVPHVCDKPDDVEKFYNSVEKNIALSGYRVLIDYMEMNIDKYKTWVPQIIIRYSNTYPSTAKLAEKGIIRLFLLVALLNNKKLVKSVINEIEMKRDLQGFIKRLIEVWSLE